MARRRQRRRSEKVLRHAAAVTSAAASGFQLAERVERLAYTRKQAAEALGVSLATLDRRVIPTIETVRTEWGARLIPVDQLERFLAERREAARVRRRSVVRSGRRSMLSAGVLIRIRGERADGLALAEIARRLNADRVPTAQGGRQWWPSTVRAVLAANPPHDV
jgi:hypothetical protein